MSSGRARVLNKYKEMYGTSYTSPKEKEEKEKKQEETWAEYKERKADEMDTRMGAVNSGFGNFLDSAGISYQTDPHGAPTLYNPNQVKEYNRRMDMLMRYKDTSDDYLEARKKKLDQDISDYQQQASSVISGTTSPEQKDYTYWMDKTDKAKEELDDISLVQGMRQGNRVQNYYNGLEAEQNALPDEDQQILQELVEAKKMEDHPTMMGVAVNPVPYTEKVESLTKELVDRGYSEEDISDYIEHGTRLSNKKATEATNQAWDEWLRSGSDAERFGKGLLGDAFSVIASPAQAVAGLYNTADAALGTASGRYNDETPVDTYGRTYNAQNTTNQIQSTISDEILHATNNKTVNMLLNTLHSGAVASASSAFQIGLCTAIAAPIEAIAGGGAAAEALAKKVGELINLTEFGASKFSSSLQEAQERGLTAEQCLQLAATQAVNEVLFEKISLDSLWGKVMAGKESSTSIKDIVKNALGQAGVEGSEEAATSFADEIADIIIAKDKSEFNQTVDKYMMNGKSREEAEQLAFRDFMGDVAQEFAAGAVSGGLMGGGATQVKNATTMNRTASQLDNETMEKVQDLAKNTDGVAAEIANSKTVEEMTTAEKGTMLNALYQNSEDANGLIKESFKEQGYSEKEAKKATELMEETLATDPDTMTEEEEKDLQGRIQNGPVKADDFYDVEGKVLRGEISTPINNLLNEVETKIRRKGNTTDKIKSVKADNDGNFVFEMQGGDRVTAEDLDLKDDEKKLVQYAMTLETPQEATQFLKNKPADVPISQYATAFYQIRNAAMEDKPLSDVKKRFGAYTSMLTDEQVLSIYDTGKNLAKELNEKALNEGNRRIVEKLSAATGVPVQFDTETGSGLNGYYEDGVVHISADTINPAAVVYAHEFVHALKDQHEDLYNKLAKEGADFLKEHDPDRYATVFNNRKVKYSDLAEEWRKNGRSEEDINSMLDEELNANMTEAVFEHLSEMDNEELKDFFTDLTERDRSLAEKILDFLKDLIETIKDALKGYKAKSLEARKLGQDLEQLERFATTLTEVMKEAGERNKTQQSRTETQKKAASVKEGRQSQKEAEDFLKEKKDEVQRFAQKALEKNGNTGYRHNHIKIAKIPGDVVKMVKKATGGDLSIDGKILAFEGSKLRHEILSHSDPKKEASMSQIAYTENDLGQFIEAVLNPDLVEDISSGDKLDQRHAVAFAKKVKDAAVVVATAGGRQNPCLVPMEMLVFSEDKWNDFMNSGKTLKEVLYANTKNRKTDSLEIDRIKKNRVTVMHHERSSFAQTSETISHSPLFESSIAPAKIKINEKIQQKDNFENRKTMKSLKEAGEDSEGRALTEDQIEFFKDAQTVDDKGPIMHGDYKKSDLSEMYRELEGAARGHKTTVEILTKEDYQNRYDKKKEDSFYDQRYHRIADGNATDKERYDILKNETIDIPNIADKDNSKIVSTDYKDAKKELKNLLHNNSIFEDEYNAGGISFDFSIGKMDESVQKQSLVSDNQKYNKLYIALQNLPSIVKSAKLIESHEDRYKGTKREDKDLERVYVFISAYAQDDNIIPVKMEVKKFKQNNRRNKLHVILTLPSVRKVGILAHDQNNSDTWAPPTSYKCSLSRLLSDIKHNPELNDIFGKYIPSMFLEKGDKTDSSQGNKLTNDRSRPSSGQNISYNDRINKMLSKKEIEDVDEIFEQEAEKLQLGRNETIQEMIRRIDGEAAEKFIDGRIANKIGMELKKDYGSAMNPTALASMLQRTFAFWAKNKNKATSEEILKTMTGIARPLMDEIQAVDNSTKEDYDNLRGYLKNKKIRLTDTQKDEVRYVYGSLNAFRSKALPYFIVSDEGSYSLEGDWADLASASNFILDERTNEGDQPIALMEALEMLKPKMVRQDYKKLGMDENQIALDIALDIYGRFMKYLSDKTGNKKLQEEVKKLKEQRVEFRKRVQEEYENKLEMIRKEELSQRENNLAYFDYKMQEAKNSMKAAEEAGDTKAAKKYENSLKYYQAKRSNLVDADEAHREEIRELKARYNNQLALRKRNQEIQKKRETVKRTANRIVTLFNTNTDKKHVPEALKVPVYNFINSIKFNAREDTLEGTRWVEKLREMKDILTNSGLANEGGFAGAYLGLMDGMDENGNAKSSLIEDMQAFMDSNAGVSLSDMGLTQLEELNGIITGLNRVINDMNTLYVNRRSESVAEIGNETIEELQQKKDRKDRNKAADGIGKLLNVSQLDSRSYFYRLGDGAMSIYDGLRQGLNKRIWRIKEAQDYMQDVTKGLNMKDWTGNKAKLHEFTINEQKLTMTTGQIMALYELRKRNQAKLHLEYGGIKPDDIDRGNKKITSKKAVSLSEYDIAKICDVLTEDQKKVADSMQQYMEKECSKWGNETTMQLYGYKRFGAKNYFPIKADKNTVDTKDTTSYFAAKNQGFTKETVERAKNALIVGDIFDIFTNHVTDMATYNAYTAPLLDAMKWFNYRNLFNEDNGATGSVKDEMDRVYGKDMQQYFKTLIQDINGGISTGAGDLLAYNKFVSNAKAAAVGANLRVIIQQPTAYFRAAAVISPKYLIRAIGDMKMVKESKEHSAIAQWKSWGYFETAIGQSMKSVITGNQSFKDKMVEKMMAGAQLADDLTWGALWKACKLEVADKHPNVKKDSEEFYKLVQDRFDDVIDQTQVVDSALHRSQIMRSKNEMAKSLTAFMSEPTKSYNLLMNRVRDFMEKKPGAKKAVVRAAAAFVVTAVVNAAAQSIIDAFRYHDSDEYKDMDYWQRWLDRFADNVKDGLNPLSIIPGMKDLLSVIQGSSNDQLWTQGISKMKQGFDKMKKWFENDNNYRYDHNFWDTFKPTLQGLSYLTGVPMYNLERDFEAIFETTTGLTIGGERYSNKENYERMADAMLTGDNEEYEDAAAYLEEKGVDESEVSSGVKSALKEKYKNGEITEDQYKDILVNQFGEKPSDVYFGVEKMEFQAEHEDEDFDKWAEITDAYLSGSSSYDEIRQEMIDNGVDEKTIDRGIAGVVKDRFERGELTEEQYADFLRDSGKDEKEIFTTMEEMDSNAENYSVYEKSVDAALAGDQTAYNQRMQELEANGFSKDDVEAEVKEKVGKKYVSGEISDYQLEDFARNFLDMNDEDTLFYMEKSRYKKENGTDDGYKKWGKAAADLLSGDRKFYVKYEDSGVEFKKIREGVNGVYQDEIKQMIEENTLTADIQAAYLDAWQLLNYKRDDKLKWITKQREAA